MARNDATFWNWVSFFLFFFFKEKTKTRNIKLIQINFRAKSLFQLTYFGEKLFVFIDLIYLFSPNNPQILFKKTI